MDHFSEVVLLDTEFVAGDGERVIPVALAAYELASGRRHRLFFDAPGAGYDNPLPQGPTVLHVAFAAQAECSTFLALGWELPEQMLDLDGFILRSESKVVRYPHRYIDERGIEMWTRIMGLLDDLEIAP